MKTLKFKRVTTVKTSPEVCLEVMYDYTHFSYLHKTSFSDFRIISERENEQILYYETKVFNFLPWSPVRQFVSIKKLMPGERKFHQVYLDLKNKNPVFFRVSMKNEGDNIQIINELRIEVSDFLYLFRGLLLKLIDLKFSVMWSEDREMLTQVHTHPDFGSADCVPKTYSLDRICEKEFDKHFKEEDKLDYFTSV